MKLLTVVGARPQFIKAAMVSRAILTWNERKPENRHIREVLVHTGQHYHDEMSGTFFRELDIPSPAYNLEVGSGPHGQQTGRMLEKLERVIQQEKPDWALVYGDTNSTLAGGIAASKLGIPVAHVEAGLRSYNRAMPEEINRVIVDHVSSLLLCPTDRAVKNLNCEGIVEEVHLVGDVMYDSLRYNLGRIGGSTAILERLNVQPQGYGLATIHRAETTDRQETLRGLMDALARIGLPIVVPLHPRTQRVLERAGMAPLPGEIRLVAPVSYHEMLVLEQHARLILTDSGGVQKEAFWLRVPCVTLRNETEWVETVESGWNRLTGTDPTQIVENARQSLQGLAPEPGAPYGDGHSAEKITGILARTRMEKQT